MKLIYEVAKNGEHLIDLEENNKDLIVSGDCEIFDIKTTRIDGTLDLFKHDFFEVIIEENKNGEYVILQDELENVSLIIRENELCKVETYFVNNKITFNPTTENTEFFFNKNMKQITRVNITINNLGE